MKRFSRSASSWMVAASSSRRRLVEQVGVGPEAAGGAQDRGQRRAQVVRDRGQQRRAQPVRLRRPPGALDVLDQVDALDRERRLVAQRVQQPPLLRGQQRAGPVAVDPDHADRAAAGPHRQEQALRARQRVGAAAGRPVVLPAPVRRGEVGLVQHVLRRIAGAHRDRAVLRQQQDDPDLEHRGDLVGRRPEQVVERADAGQLAAEEVEVLGHLGPLAGRDRLVAHPGGEVARDHGDEEEEEQGDDVVGIGDGEGVERRQEEEVEGQDAEQAGVERGPQAEGDGARQHRRQEDQRHALDAEERSQPEADAERRRHRQRVVAR